MIWLILVACESDTDAALAACKAVPGLSVDAAGLELLRERLTPEEIALLAKAEPTAGSKAVDWTALRARTRCSGSLTEDRIALVRTLPTVDAEGKLGADQEQSFTWTLVDGRFQTGLAEALAQRAAIPADPIEALGAWTALAEAYPDPTLAVDLAIAREAHDKAVYIRDEMTLELDEATDKVRLVVSNYGDRALSRVEVTVELAGAKPLVLEHENFRPDSLVKLIRKSPVENPEVSSLRISAIEW